MSVLAVALRLVEMQGCGQDVGPPQDPFAEGIGVGNI